MMVSSGNRPSYAPHHGQGRSTFQLDDASLGLSHPIVTAIS
jgi:hypothetical protein